jgi:lipopolysaccharide heptosyltransferase II
MTHAGGDGDAARRWRHVRRVLAIRLDNLGDVLMTTPALAAIHESAPGVRLGLLASPGAASVAACLPFVDEVMPFDAPWVKAGAAALAAGPLGAAEQRLVESLRNAGYDAAVIFGVCTQSALPAALLCRLAGIPLRLAHARENPYGLLSDWVPETDRVQDGMRHEVERQLALVASVGWHTEDTRLRLVPSAAQRARLAALLDAAGWVAGMPYVVVHPGASAASRRWPATRFGAVAREIALHTGAAVVFTGGIVEHALVEQARLEMGVPCVSLAGQLGIGELAALIGDARLLLANNTGPAHIAAAMGTPVVVLYAQTNPQHTPWKVPSRVMFHAVPCRNCLKSVCPMGHHDCLMKVPVDAVAEAAFALLGEGDAGCGPQRAAAGAWS